MFRPERNCERKFYRLEPGAKGYVVTVYYDAESFGQRKADVVFPGGQEPERGIPLDELEVIE